MSGNIIDALKPNLLPPYSFGKEDIRCNCGTEEEYQSFLISEYGIETFLRVQKERKESEKFWSEFYKNTRRIYKEIGGLL